MKKLNVSLFLGILGFSLSMISCGKGGGGPVGGSGSGYKGNVLGIQGREKYREEVPYGMVSIPSGTLTLGQGDQDVTFDLTARTKQVSIKSFYMDATEITNNEYRQFVEYVKDSMAHAVLNHFAQDAKNPDQEAGAKNIDWKQKIDYKNPEVLNQLSALYYPQDQWINGQREMDMGKLMFKYDVLKYREAAFAKLNKIKDRKQYLKPMVVPVYPDTMVWVRDFTYSYNEPMTRQYFSHPAYDDYPVVGVTWDQANAFAHWRTDYLNNYRKSKKKSGLEIFRLPTEGEWEYAARGGKKSSPYPWGGPYTRNQKGCILANFKPTRGNYQEDGGFHTVRVDSYFPNDFGLYNMAGNVAEWTSTQYYENSGTFTHDMNPDMRYDHSTLDNETMKRKVIRGGSWKDIALYLQNHQRSFEYADSAKSYVGFRCLMSSLK
ncbi:MAG: SUMF1/EgtB/PvdO family nonheme iron enzyme [Chitinophagales bacterium]|nr:SUMF1/EgtB/PvdO family nonheme iron enzyme [Chitinophagales bacterium]